MAAIKLAIVIIAAAVSYVAAQGKPHPEIVLDTAGFDIKENQWIKDWGVTIAPGGQVMSVHTNIEEDLPDDLMVSCTVNYNGQDVINFDTSVCEALEDEKIAKNVLKYAPDYPDSCPFTKGDNYKIVDYPVENDKLPPDTKPGPVIVTCLVYHDIDNPYVTLNAAGEIVIVNS